MRRNHSNMKTVLIFQFFQCLRFGVLQFAVAVHTTGKYQMVATGTYGQLL
eukprot:m.14108 g.14108  ORF g.14108 m.14108 type:complete len:50 (+) comp10300_c0_seq2:470-619(+)